MTDAPNPSRPDNTRPAEDADALACPGCGYNLHGICTAQSPTGECPECGYGYSPQNMRPSPRRARRASLVTLLVVEVLLFPVGVLLVSFGLFSQIRSGGWVVVLIVPALATIPAALFMAWQYRVLCNLRVAKPYRSSPGVSLLLMTLLFTIVLYILAGTYFCGGCLYLLTQFSL